MPRRRKGGTDKWCPQCRKIRVCKAVNPSQLGAKSGQRRHRHKADIHWFCRGLVCKSCGNQWLTAEVPEKLLTELEKLRDKVQKASEALN